MTEIQYKLTLLEYDGPQIFEARDRIGGHYIAVAIGENGAYDQYLVVGTEVEKLRKFRTGEMDLRSLLVESSEHGWYLTASSMNQDRSITITPQQGNLAHYEYLPDPEFYLHNSKANNTLISEARARDNLVLELVAAPLENQTAHRIQATTLSGLLEHFQRLIFQACHEIFENSNRHLTRNEIKNLSQMDVVIPAAAGSFRLLLEASKPKDLLGINTELVSALETVDEMFDSVANTHERQSSKSIRRKSSNEFDKLMQFLKKNDTNLNYAWADPSFEKPRCSNLSYNHIRSYVSTMHELPQPNSENVTLTGEIERVNRKLKKWGLITSDGNILYGVVDEDGHQLNGLTVGERYEFFCLKETSQDNEVKYVMKGYKPL